LIMLILTRTLGERIIIGDGVTCPRIVITVTDVDRGKVRIGVQCDRDIPVWRGELLPERRPAPGGES